MGLFSCLDSLATSAIRLIVFIFNLIIVIFGITLFVLGIIYQIKVGSFTTLVKENVGALPILSIVLGAFMFLVAFLGCCGALKEHKCMLRTYGTILAILLILEIVICYFSFKLVDNPHLKDEVHNSLDKWLDEYNTNKETRDNINSMQLELECCGMKGSQDYRDRHIFTNGSLPLSCCGLKDSDTKPCLEIGNDHFTVGCMDKIDDILSAIGKVLGIIAIVIAIILASGTVFGCCLSCR